MADTSHNQQEHVYPVSRSVTSKPTALPQRNKITLLLGNAEVSSSVIQNVTGDKMESYQVAAGNKLSSHSCQLLLPTLSFLLVMLVFGASRSTCAQEATNSVFPSLPVGTSIDLPHAIKAILSHLSETSADGVSDPFISASDLRRIARGSDPNLSKELKDAAVFFLSSPVDRDFVDSGDGGRSADGLIYKSDLDQALRTISQGHYESVLMAISAANVKRDSIGKLEYATVLRDPGVPVDIRNKILRKLSNAQLAQIIGLPDLQGDVTDRTDEANAFLALARASWLGAAEAEILSYYRVPFTMDRAAQDQGYSFWNDQAMHISEKMTKSGAPGYISEVLAHEGGHAIFAKSGLKTRVFKDMDKNHLTPGIANIANEAFAGVFGNRAHVALFGYNDQNIDRHLSLINDVTDNIASDSTYYAKRYHVNTAAARAQILNIAQVIDQDMVPYLQNTFNLLGDPLLIRGLEVSRRIQ